MSETTYHAFMLDHATGTLPPALMVAGDLHVCLSEDGAEAAAIWDAVGGALLEGSQLGENGPTLSRRRPRRMRRPSPASLLSCDLDRLSWRRGLSGVRHARAGVRGGAFMRLEPGQSVPAHGHSALEATVVLRGELRVGERVHRVGDLALGVPGQAHKPEAESDAACICFVGRGAKPFWRLT